MAIEETEAELGGDASALVKEAKKLLRRKSEEALTNAIEKKPVDVSALEAALEAEKEHIPGTSAVAKRASVMLEKVMSERGSDGIVSPPTPDHLWWEPEKGWPDRGWPRTSYYWRPEAMRSGVGECPPKEFTTTTEQTPCRMPLPTEVLGTLYVEVLEADGLRQTDLLSHSDPYALVIFEGFAAITVWVNNTLKPRWPHDSARAFKLPVTHPNSDLRVALFDHDDGIVDDDDKLGRVVISLGGMYPRTEYDAWFPLQRKATRHHLKRHGRVRLRYRLEWKHERAALLHAAAAPPAFKIPFTTPLYAKAALCDPRRGPRARVRPLHPHLPRTKRRGMASPSSPSSGPSAGALPVAYAPLRHPPARGPAAVLAAVLHPRRHHLLYAAARRHVQGPQGPQDASCTRRARSSA